MYYHWAERAVIAVLDAIFTFDHPVADGNSDAGWQQYNGKEEAIMLKSIDRKWHLCPGEEVIVQTSFIVRGNKMFLECMILGC